MNTVTMLELRNNARQLVDRLLRGEAFELSYRNRVVARILPVWKEPVAARVDPVYTMAGDAEDIGAGLQAAEADQLLYGE
jgi:antitoxin (DNA-binding transcriptional repressor) of toxin-antitoxin stability system